MHLERYLEREEIDSEQETDDLSRPKYFSDMFHIYRAEFLLIDSWSTGEML